MDRRKNGRRIARGKELRGAVERHDGLDAWIGERAESERPDGERIRGIAAQRMAEDTDPLGIDRAFQEVPGRRVEAEKLVDQDAHVARAIDERIGVTVDIEEIVALVIDADDYVAVAREVGHQEQMCEARLTAARRVHEQWEGARRTRDVAVGRRRDERYPKQGDDVWWYAGHGLGRRWIVDLRDERARPGSGGVLARWVEECQRPHADGVRPEERRRPEAQRRIHAQCEMPAAGDDDVREHVDAILEHRTRSRRDETERIERRAAAAGDVPPRVGAYLRDTPVTCRTITAPARELRDVASAAVGAHHRVAYVREPFGDKALAGERRGNGPIELVSEHQVDEIVAPFRAGLRRS